MTPRDAKGPIMPMSITSGACPEASPAMIRPKSSCPPYTFAVKPGLAIVSCRVVSLAAANQATSVGPVHHVAALGIGVGTVVALGTAVGIAVVTVGSEVGDTGGLVAVGAPL